jgi:large subunit ribosomal protein L28
MAKVCEITGKHTRSGNNVSHANNKTKRCFYPNLQKKNVYLEELGISIKMRIATSTLRNINKKGLMPVLKAAYAKGTLSPELRRFATCIIQQKSTITNHNNPLHHGQERK